MDELIAIAGVSLTGAAMTVTVLVLGASEDLIPARNAMFIRVPALMLASLVIGSIASALLAAMGSTSLDVRTAFLVTFALCLGELLFVSVYLLRVPVFVHVFRGRFWQFANSTAIWAASTGVIIALFFMLLWASRFTLRPTLFGLGITTGWSLSVLFMWPYVRYGFSGYEETFTPSQFYEILEQRVEEFLFMRAASQTPILLLPTEADPAQWPLPGRSKHPSRVKLSAAYARYAEHGLPIRYLVREERLTEELKAYGEFGRHDYVKEVVRRLKHWESQAPNLEIRMIARDGCDPMAEGQVLHEYPLVARTTGPNGLVIRAARGLHAKIRHAEMIRSARLTESLIEQFDRVWSRSEPLSSARLIRILNEQGLTVSEQGDDANTTRQ